MRHVVPVLRRDDKLSFEITQCIDWQVRQVYRVINALMASTVLKQTLPLSALATFKSRLEASESLHPILEAIRTEKLTPDIFCSGHGCWNPADGFIDYKNSIQTIKLYAPISSSISDQLGTAIESRRYNQNEIITVARTQTYSRAEKNLSSISKSTTQEYPKLFNSSSAEQMPNLRLASSSKLKARIIEDLTGRILFQTDKHIYLAEIHNTYANRKTIHWAACISTPNLDIKIKWDMLTYKNQQLLWQHTDNAAAKRPPIDSDSASKKVRLK